MLDLGHILKVKETGFAHEFLRSRGDQDNPSLSHRKREALICSDGETTGQGFVCVSSQ